MEWSTTFHWSSSNVTNASTQEDDRDKLIPYSEWFVIILWFMTAIFSIETIFGNLLVLMAYKLERNIRRQLSNKFIVSLAVTDLIIGMEGFPLLTVYVVAQQFWPLGQILCQIWLWLDYTLCLVSILTVLLITVDRYCSVCYPAKYRTWQTNTRVRLFVVFSWIIPALFFGFMIFAWDPLTGNSMDDSGKCYAPFLTNPLVNMSMYIVYYWTTLVAVSVLYRGIHTAAKTLEDKSKAKERQTIALLLGQRCMAQVGVGMLLHSSASEEGIAQHEMTYFQQKAGDGKMEIGHDSGYMTTTTATATTHTQMSHGSSILATVGFEPGQRGSLAYDIPTSNLPIIITQSPPTSLSLSSTKITQPVHGGSVTPEMTSPIKNRRPNDCDQKEEITPLVSDNASEKLSLAPSASISSTTSLFTMSPTKSIISVQNQHQRRGTLPAHSQGSSPKICPDKNEEKRSRSLIERRQRSSKYKKPVQKRPIFHQDSGCSLDLYDSNCTSMSSLYGDTSLNSVLEFGNLLQSLDSEETSTVTSICSGPHQRTRSWRISELFNTRSKPKHANGDLNRTSSLTSSTWTRSASTSVRSHCSTQLEENTSVHSSPRKTRDPDESALPPIIEEEKSTTTRTDAELISRRSSMAPSSIGSPPILKTDHAKKPSEKIVHLTVPEPTPPGFGFGFGGRKPSQTSPTGRRRGNEADWHRSSWQSTASSIYQRRKSRRGTRVDDEDDSEGRDHPSSAEESNSDRKRSSSWLATLFNNPVAIIQRKRKVTKAEKRARKAFRTITVIVGTFALFWSPYYIVATIYGFCPDCVPTPLFLTSYYLCYLNSSVNPFAYAFANRLFRKTFIRILKGDLRRT